MREAHEVKAIHVEVDKQYKILGREYKETSRIIMRHIKKTKDEIGVLVSESPYKAHLKEQLRILNQMFRTTRDIGREAEHYYEKGWCRSDVYTVNKRKRG